MIIVMKEYQLVVVSLILEPEIKGTMEWAAYHPHNFCLSNFCWADTIVGRSFLNTFYKNLSMWLVIGLTMVLLFNLFNKPQTQNVEITYSDFLSSVESGTISQVTIEGDQITGTMRGGTCGGPSNCRIKKQPHAPERRFEPRYLKCRRYQSSKAYARHLV